MVFTNEKCVGCNKCIRSCPVITANVAGDEKLMLTKKCVSSVVSALTIAIMVQEILRMIHSGSLPI